MTDVRFYHLTRTRLEDALPVMLGRTLERRARARAVHAVERLTALAPPRARNSLKINDSTSWKFMYQKHF